MLVTRSSVLHVAAAVAIAALAACQGADEPPPPPPPPPPSSGTWVTGYYAGWYPGEYPPETVDMTAMTHFVFGRAASGDGTWTSSEPPYDGRIVQPGEVVMAAGSSGNRNARPLVDRAHAAGIKAILMMGGAGEASNWYASTADGVRATFVENVLDFLVAYDFDGIDVDWEENLDDGGTRPDTQRRLLAFVQELRAASPSRARYAGDRPLIILFPGPWVSSNEGLPDPFFAELAAHVDQFNFMSYSMAGNWGGWTSWMFSALTGEAPNHPSSVSYTANAYAAIGIPKEKIGIGIGFYGFNYGPPNTGPGEPTDGVFQASEREWRYARLVQGGYLANGEYRWDAASQTSYRSYPGGYQPLPATEWSEAGFLSYEDEASIAAKGAWVRANGFGGAIIWTVNYGCTNPTTGENPLLDAVKTAFLE